MASSSPQSDSLNHSDLPSPRDLEPIYDAFESAWRSDERPELADYLARVPKAVEASVFGHLLALELSYRRDLGERPRADEYKEVFPECEHVIEDVFENRHVHTPAISSRMVPDKIWRYELIRRLGAGGQAEVFLGKHELLEREVVVKLARHVCVDLSEEDRLINEGRILVQLTHPYLGRVENLDFYNGHPFLIMRHERGRSLSKLADEVPFSPTDAARIVAQVAQAVALAHGQGIVHLDIKPGNVLLREDGSPCLIDFGLAQVVRAADPMQKDGHSVVGTAAYMSPEQAAGDWARIGPRSDVFGLGALLYWLLTGHAPFQGSTFTQCMNRARTGAIDTSRLKKSRVPRRLKDMCLRAMSHDPAKRFASAEDCATELERFLSFRLSASSPGTVARAYAGVLGRLLRAVFMPLLRLPQQWSPYNKGSRVTDARFQGRPGLGQLGSPELSYDRDLTAVDLEKQAGLRQLKSLRLTGPNITDAGLRALAMLGQLRSLELVDCPNVTDVGLMELPGLRGLKSLKLLNCPGVTDAGLSHLEGLTKLKHLSIIRTQATGEGVKNLRQALPNCVVY